MRLQQRPARVALDRRGTDRQQRHRLVRSRARRQIRTRLPGSLVQVVPALVPRLALLVKEQVVAT